MLNRPIPQPNVARVWPTNPAKDLRPYKFTIECVGCGKTTELSTNDPSDKGWEVVDDTEVGGVKYWLCPECQCV